MEEVRASCSMGVSKKIKRIGIIVKVVGIGVKVVGIGVKVVGIGVKVVGIGVKVALNILFYNTLNILVKVFYILFFYKIS